MQANDTRSIKITYKQLDRALHALGFVRIKSQAYRVYRQEEKDALIAVPLLHSNALVSDPHIVGVRNTIIGRGIATWDALYAELVKARQAHPVPTPHSESTNTISLPSMGSK